MIPANLPLMPNHKKAGEIAKGAKMQYKGSKSTRFPFFEEPMYFRDAVTSMVVPKNTVVFENAGRAHSPKLARRGVGP